MAVADRTLDGQCASSRGWRITHLKLNITFSRKFKSTVSDYAQPRSFFPPRRLQPETEHRVVRARSQMANAASTPYSAPQSQHPSGGRLLTLLTPTIPPYISTSAWYCAAMLRPLRSVSQALKLKVPRRLCASTWLRILSGKRFRDKRSVGRFVQPAHIREICSQVPLGQCSGAELGSSPTANAAPFLRNAARTLVHRVIHTHSTAPHDNGF